MRSNVLLIAFLALPFFASAQTNNYANGATVADFTVTDIDGQTHNLNAYTAAGKYVMLDFFFYNCGPCQQNAPSYSQFFQTYGCNGGDVVCISVNNGSDSDALAASFHEAFAPGYSHAPTIGSGGGQGTSGQALTSTFGVSAFPTFALISPAKIMVNRDIYPIASMQTFVNAFPAGSIIPQSCAVGIDENDVASFTEVFPVPSQGIITLNISSRTSSNVTVEVVDVLGQLVATHSFNGRNGSSTQTLDLTKLSDGQYFLKLKAGSQTADTQRIVIAH